MTDTRPTSLAQRGSHAVGRTFRSLRTRNYRIYAVGSLLSVSGSWMQRIAQDWLIVELGGGGVALGISVAAQFMPLPLLGMWGGLIVDRANRRRLVLLTQFAQAVLAVGLAAVVLTDIATLPLVYAFGLALGLVSVFDIPGRQVLVAEMVPHEDIANAQALYSSIHNAGRLVGPALAGVIIAASSLGVAFLVNAVSFVAVLVSLLRLDRSQLRTPPPLARAPGQVRAALSYCWQVADLRACMIVVTVVDVFGQNFRVMLPLLATGPLGGDVQTYGNLVAAIGVGAVIGAFASAAAASVRLGPLLASCALFGAINLAVVGVTGTVGSLLLMGLLGFGNVVFNNLARSLAILRASVDMRGRVMALHTIVSRGGTPIGAPIMGAICALGGVRVAFAVAAIMTFAAVLLVLPSVRHTQRIG